MKLKTGLTIALLIMVPILAAYTFYMAGYDRGVETPLPFDYGKDLCTGNSAGIDRFYVPSTLTNEQLTSQWKAYLASFDSGCTVTIDPQADRSPWLPPVAQMGKEPEITSYKELYLKLSYPQKPQPFRSRQVKVWIVALKSGEKKLWPDFSYPIIAASQPFGSRVDLVTSEGAIKGSYQVTQPGILLRYKDKLWLGVMVKLMPSAEPFTEYRVKLFVLKDNAYEASGIDDPYQLPQKYQANFMSAHGPEVLPDVAIVRRVWFAVDENTFDPDHLFLAIKASILNQADTQFGYSQVSVDTRPSGESPYYNPALSVVDIVNPFKDVAYLSDSSAEIKNEAGKVIGGKWMFEAVVDTSAMKQGQQIQLSCGAMQLYLADERVLSSSCDFDQIYIQGERRKVIFSFATQDEKRSNWAPARLEYRYLAPDGTLEIWPLWAAGQ
jgi:hypothetical protein